MNEQGGGQRRDGSKLRIERIYQDVQVLVPEVTRNTLKSRRNTMRKYSPIDLDYVAVFFLHSKSVNLLNNFFKM